MSAYIKPSMKGEEIAISSPSCGCLSIQVCRKRVDTKADEKASCQPFSGGTGPGGGEP
jgi:hypothetical protein